MKQQAFIEFLTDKNSFFSVYIQIVFYPYLYLKVFIALYTRISKHLTL